MLIRNKREFVARRLGDLGVLRLLERVARRPCLLVATYHRIGIPQSTLFYDPVDSASPEAFEAQVRHLRDRFRLLRLEELVALADSGFPINEPTALLTFDDGYRDNHDVALPILEALGVSATFFLPTGFLSRPRLPWWDHIAYVLKQTRQSTVVLERPISASLDLACIPREEAIWTVIRAFMQDRDVDEASFLSHLEERAGVAVDSAALGEQLFMTWDQVRRLAQAGMTIGSHTHDHPFLARLSEEDQLRELAESRTILERELGREIVALAYPFGDSGTFDEATKRAARMAGYRLAFSAQHSANRPGRIDPFAIGRLGVGVADTPALFRARVVCYACFGASVF